MKNRLVFIDLLRGWAALVMVEVHVFNAFILPHFKEAGWFGLLNFVNGLVAPAFLFVAGFVFVFVSERKLDEFRTFGAAFWKQLSRILLIWGIGYGLHLPYFSFARTLSETNERGWLKFYQVDILHCIALGLLILFLARIYIRRNQLYQRLLFLVGAGSVLVAPFIWAIDFNNSLPAPIAAYLNGKHFSQFPVFNWLGFMMFGGLAAAAYAQVKNEGSELKHLIRVGYLSGGLIAVGSLLIELPVRIPFASTAIRANPLFFGARLGIILLLMLVCWYYTERRKTERSFVLDVSRESLLVYTAHLLVIYGDFWDGKSLASLHGKTLGVGECIAATLGLVALMVMFAKGWGWLKRTSFSSARVVSYATAIVVVLLFFIPFRV